MANTEYRSYPLPDEAKTVKEEFETFAAFTLPMIDLDMQSLFDALGNKAPIDHEHGIGDIAGLSNALQGLMPNSKTFAITDLTDVEGAAEAPNGYVLIKTAGKWLAQAAAAALGAHEHAIEQITGLVAALNSKAGLTSAVLFDRVQELSTAQKNRAKANMGVTDPTPGDITADALAPAISSAPGKATPVNADVLGIVDSAADGLLKKLTWANLKATLKTYFDGLYSAAGHDHTFASLTAKPTTRAGYGITDAAPIPSSSAYPVGMVLQAFLPVVGGSALSVANGGTTAGSNLRALTWAQVKGAGGVISGLVASRGVAGLPGTWRNISGQTLSTGSVDDNLYPLGGIWVRTA
ncbi:hypothetical protein [Devosia ginsengisoli]|uniref:hypothetical protein n=1 Tax=Devosia ginsengisoli TaxID=400770 RepID=UPI0026EA1137|nr:hypothetical protein [Devosia ginsengisoli]MCR6672203.1 hypothetical protein [Devosia ginsengisoli]